MTQDPDSQDQRSQDRGATQKPAESAEAGTINVVEDSGAAGDGATDDTAPIRETLLAASGTGRVVYFPPGSREDKAWAPDRHQLLLRVESRRAREGQMDHGRFVNNGVDACGYGPWFERHARIGRLG